MPPVRARGRASESRGAAVRLEWRVVVKEERGRRERETETDRETETGLQYGRRALRERQIQKQRKEIKIRPKKVHKTTHQMKVMFILEKTQMEGQYVD